MDKIKKILKIKEKLEKETTKEEKALLVRYNKNMNYDLKKYIDRKRKLIKFNKNLNN